MATYKTTYRHEKLGRMDVTYPELANPFVSFNQNDSRTTSAVNFAADSIYRAMLMTCDIETAATACGSLVDLMVTDMGFTRTSTVSL